VEPKNREEEEKKKRMIGRTEICPTKQEQEKRNLGKLGEGGALIKKKKTEGEVWGRTRVLLRGGKRGVKKEAKNRNAV